MSAFPPTAAGPELLTFSEYGPALQGMADEAKRVLVAWLANREPGRNGEGRWAEDEDPVTLGLKVEPNGDVNASHFVGQVWVKPQELAIVVKPKAGKMLRLATSMLRASLADPQAAAHLDEMFWFWPEQDSLTFERPFSGLDFLVSVLYLKSLDWLCQRHLRRSFQKEVSNLPGRVKGKILIGQTIRSNVALAKLDHVWCSYQAHTMDTPPNRVLRTALEQARRCLHRAGITDIPIVLEWLAVCHATLDSVPLTRIEPNDVSRVVPRASVDRPYREPLRLARMVLALLGSDPVTDQLGGAPKVPPFAIDMNELFERFCEAGLRKVPRQQVWAGYKKRVGNLGKQFEVRPDFLVTDENGSWIVDAKYKPNWDWAREEHRPDVAQIMTYSRHRRVLEKLKLNPDQDRRPTAVILYPGSQGENSVDTMRGIRLQESCSSGNLPDDRVLRDFQVPVVRTAIRLPE